MATNTGVVAPVLLTVKFADVLPAAIRPPGAVWHRQGDAAARGLRFGTAREAAWERCALSSAAIACFTHWRSALASPVQLQAAALRRICPRISPFGFWTVWTLTYVPPSNSGSTRSAGTGTAAAPPARLFWSRVIRTGP